MQQAEKNSFITTCTRCQSNANVRRYKRKTANGRWQVLDWCILCNRVADSQKPFIKLIYVNDFEDIPELPAMKVYQNGPICAVCGSSKDVEFHHWAPRYIFGNEAEKWPFSYLCLECHKKWHKLVTPRMSEQKNRSIRRI